MSKRAEEAALKAYPVDICGYTVECRVGAKPQPQDWNEIRRTHFQEGYELAEKDLGWHSVDEFLPPIGEEVIVLRDELSDCLLPDAGFVGVGHIVDRRYAMDYNGWNVPGVKYWMPMPKIPNEDE